MNEAGERVKPKPERHRSLWIILWGIWFVLVIKFRFQKASGNLAEDSCGRGTEEKPRVQLGRKWLDKSRKYKSDYTEAGWGGEEEREAQRGATMRISKICCSVKCGAWWEGLARMTTQLRSIWITTIGDILDRKPDAAVWGCGCCTKFDCVGLRCLREIWWRCLWAAWERNQN